MGPVSLGSLSKELLYNLALLAEVTAYNNCCFDMFQGFYQNISRRERKKRNWRKEEIPPKQNLLFTSIFGVHIGYKLRHFLWKKMQYYLLPLLLMNQIHYFDSFNDYSWLTVANFYPKENLSISFYKLCLVEQTYVSRFTVISISLAFAFLKKFFWL